MHIKIKLRLIFLIMEIIQIQTINKKARTLNILMVRNITQIKSQILINRTFSKIIVKQTVVKSANLYIKKDSNKMNMLIKKKSK
jgi:hypothetical protein